MDAQAEAAGDLPDRNQPASEGAVRDLIEVVQHLATTNTWRYFGRIFVGVSIVSLIGGGIGLSVIAYQTHQQAQCVQTWANATATRTNVLSPLTATQLRAINDAFKAVKAAQTDQAAGRKLFDKALPDEIAAYEAYRTAYGDNPPPPNPALIC